MLHAVVVRSPVAAAASRASTRAPRSPCPACCACSRMPTSPTPVPAIPIRVGRSRASIAILQRPLAGERVRYVGEPLALVLAEDPLCRRGRRRLVFADIEPDAGRHHRRRARRHALAASRASARTSRAPRRRARRRRRSLRARRLHAQGALRCHRHSSVPLETRGLVAEWDAAAATLRVWGATKVPFFTGARSRRCSASRRRRST